MTIASIDSTEFITETDVQSEDIEEIKNKKDFRNYEMFMYLLSKIKSSFEVPRVTPIRIEVC